MNLQEVQQHWHAFGKMDPMWAILTWPDRKDNKWQRDEFFQTGVIEIDLVIQYIKSFGITIPRHRALDFGCGIGRLTQALAHYFEEVYGVDISPSMIELAKKYNLHDNRCKYLLNDVDNLRVFNDNTLDFIYTNITLQHIEPQYSKNYIKEFLRILAPGGLLIFHLPELRPVHDGAPGNRYKQFIKGITPEILLHFYRQVKARRLEQPIMEVYGIERAEILRLLAEHGATIVDVRDAIEATAEYMRRLGEHGIKVDSTLAEMHRTMAARRGIDLRYCVTKG